MKEGVKEFLEFADKHRQRKLGIRDRLSKVDKQYMLRYLREGIRAYKKHIERLKAH